MMVSMTVFEVKGFICQRMERNFPKHLETLKVILIPMELKNNSLVLLKVAMLAQLERNVRYIQTLSLCLGKIAKGAKTDDGFFSL